MQFCDWTQVISVQPNYAPEKLHILQILRNKHI